MVAIAAYVGLEAAAPSLPGPDIAISSIKAEMRTELQTEYPTAGAMASDILRGVASPVPPIPKLVAALVPPRASAARIVSHFAPVHEWGNPVPKPDQASDCLREENGLCVEICSIWLFELGCLVTVRPLTPWPVNDLENYPPDRSECAREEKGVCVEECLVSVGANCIATLAPLDPQSTNR